MDLQPLIYHITAAVAWREALESGQYRADSLGTEGFIHCSTRDQVAATANLLFRGQNDLVLLEVDPTLLISELRYEPAPNGQLFPHIYGPIFVDAVKRVLPFNPAADGNFHWQDEGSEPS